MSRLHKNIWGCTLTIVCAAVLTSIGGCNSNDSSQSANPTTAKHERLAQLTVNQQSQKNLAVDAKDKLFESLLAELMNSMGEKGPAKSISVCKTRAPEIAKSVSEEMGVKIGRTSFQLRNDANQPPAWSAGFVSERVEESVEVVLPNGGLGVLLPIRLKATCLLCHGSKDQVIPEVKAAITSNYPNDTATGFSEGDIRGYFWIEVPASDHVSNY